MTSPAAHGSPHAIGTVVDGKYRIEKELGHGGMGVVVQATHLQLRELVALKFLHAEVARNASHVERFLREARAAARIRSEHVARVLDVGTLATGESYMVMEFLTGQDLNQVSRARGLLPTGEAVGYVLQACQAMAEAHRLGIVHRDLKPANLFLTQRADGAPLVKVLDFGISKLMGTDDEALTATSDFLGSPVYMSPEQIRDARGVDGRSDIWALGSILYKLLAGRAPFASETSAGTLARIIADPVPPLRTIRPDVGVELSAVISRCLEKSADKRYPRIEDLAAALEAAMRAEGPAAWSAPPSVARDGRESLPSTSGAPSRSGVASVSASSSVVSLATSPSASSGSAIPQGAMGTVALSPGEPTMPLRSDSNAGASAAPRSVLPSHVEAAIAGAQSGTVSAVASTGATPRTVARTRRAWILAGGISASGVVVGALVIGVAGSRSTGSAPSAASATSSVAEVPPPPTSATTAVAPTPSPSAPSTSTPAASTSAMPSRGEAAPPKPLAEASGSGGPEPSAATSSPPAPRAAATPSAARAQPGLFAKPDARPHWPPATSTANTPIKAVPRYGQD